MVSNGKMSGQKLVQRVKIRSKTIDQMQQDQRELLMRNPKQVTKALKKMAIDQGNKVAGKVKTYKTMITKKRINPKYGEVINRHTKTIE